ncbi:unnamed protein product [Prunus armeniaca]|uniref:Uncharacterized protein n=1 Tax=Prunus armeniaca TaxID=36596 RepID=A0A6J5WC98_PRUAR|nr:unnamed protein product [Prunus armeniaca]
MFTLHIGLVVSERGCPEWVCTNDGVCWNDISPAALHFPAPQIRNYAVNHTGSALSKFDNQAVAI